MKCVISEKVVNYDFETDSSTLVKILSDLELKGGKRLRGIYEFFSFKLLELVMLLYFNIRRQKLFLSYVDVI